MSEKRVVKVIPATHRYQIKDSKIQKKRVAAYCRVSTDSEEQASSYEAQVEYYTHYINERNDWELVEVFADDGISGTNTKKRTEFNRMIQSCIDGNIDMIITKSISRFARNTLDCLKYIRQLKEYGVPVYFEKENINTMDSKGEVLLTIMASLAQQESESISKNVKMGIQYRYQKGEIRVNHKRFMGYTKDESGNLVVEAKGAEVVRRIFKEYLEGLSLGRIAKGLMADGILTAANNPVWRGESVRKILSNEKYMGDALLQKTYTVDVLNKKRVNNDGIVPQYYVENSHEAIVSKEMFHRVQVELKRRAVLSPNHSTKKATYSSKYVLSNIVTCEKCGHFYRRVAGNSRGNVYVNWRCKTRITKGVSCCDATSISERELHNTIVRAINKFIGGREGLKADLDKTVESVLRNEILNIETIDERMVELQKELEIYIHQNKDYTQIIEELDKLKIARQQAEERNQEAEVLQNRLASIKEFISEQSILITEYDEEIARKMLSQVIVGDKAIEIVFQTGKSVKLNRVQR